MFSIYFWYYYDYFQDKYKNLQDSLNVSDVDCDDDDIPEDEIRTLCEELNFVEMSEDLVQLNRRIRLEKKNDPSSCKHFVAVVIDDFAGFVVDASTAILLQSINQQFQVTINFCCFFFFLRNSVNRIIIFKCFD